MTDNAQIVPAAGDHPCWRAIALQLGEVLRPIIPMATHRIATLASREAGATLGENGLDMHKAAGLVHRADAALALLATADAPNGLAPAGAEEASHAAEPWSADIEVSVRFLDDGREEELVEILAAAGAATPAYATSREDARRIAACINACRGLSLAQLQVMAAAADPGKRPA